MAVRLRDDYLTIPEAAEQLGVAESTIRRWIREERLQAYRLGDRRILLKRVDLDRLVRPVRKETEPSTMTIETDIDRIRGRRLTPEEQARGFAAMAELDRLGHEMAERRDGKPYVPVVQLLYEEREARTRRIMGS